MYKKSKSTESIPNSQQTNWRKKLFWLNLVVMIAIAFNLRAPISSIGPMIESIRSYFNLSAAMAGLLTTLPLIAFGAVSFLVMYFSPIRAIVLGLCLIILGEIVRSFCGEFGLFLGMALIGAGIAIANVLLPSFVKEKFGNKSHVVMSVYSLTLSLSTIAGIALSLPLLMILPLKYAMIFWVIFAFIALFAYIPHTKNGRIFRTKKRNSANINLFKHKGAWTITLFMGLQSFISYSIFTWLVAIIAEKGYSHAFGANVLLVSQIVAIPISLLGPILMGRIRRAYKAPYMAILCGCYFASFIIFWICNSPFWLYMAAAILGLPLGGVFGIALLFISTKSKDSIIATKLSSMSQGFGYLLASSSPFLLGFLHDVFGSFNEGLIMLIFASLAVSLCGLLAYKLPIIDYE